METTTVEVGERLAKKLLANYAHLGEFDFDFMHEQVNQDVAACLRALGCTVAPFHSGFLAVCPKADPLAPDAPPTDH